MMRQNRCVQCGQLLKPKRKKKNAATRPKARKEPETILGQYRQLLQHHPEVISGLLLH